MEFIQGPVGPTACLIDKFRINECSLRGECIFMGMWKKIHDAILDVYNNTTFGDLLQQEKEQTPLCVTSGQSESRKKTKKQKVKRN